MGSQAFQQKYGPWAVVTGGALGLGKAWCAELASRGLNIVSVDRLPEALQQQSTDLKSQYGVEVRTIHADLTDENILATVESATSDLEVGFLVCSAAMETDPEIVHPHLFHEGSLEFHRDLININVKAACELTYHFGKPMMERKRGGIVLISSGADGQGAPFVAHYGASKAYLTVLGEGLWFELQPHGVDAISAPLGMTRTTALEDFPEVEAMDPGDVVREILSELGKSPQLIPGRKNRFGQTVMKKLITKKRAIRMFADIHLNNFLKGRSEYDVYRK
ncbi:MAG: SDR family NAD(P)-dependent oxidoreductase [Candidatus Binatia bacterium]|nr:SDR family NAD(P)-dependent oxidoreductase [Candidatus Binatia bacterium]